MSDSDDCIFCQIVAGEIGTKIHEDGLVVAFEDLSPQAPNHTLIIPKEHLGSTDDLAGGGDEDPEKEMIAGRLLTTAARLAREKGIEAGYRLVVNCGESAGQSVFHLHVHLLGGRPFTWPPG